ncbi:MAG TPA: hypothetical protein VNO26_06795 [Candidatus Limnocylindria bacterium]|nr:hypothetical protein [Candidatus Limnocylindria bacterium]
MTIHGLSEARRALGDAVLGPEEIGAALDVDPLADLTAAERAAVERIPFDSTTLAAARPAGEMLVLRIPRLEGAPLTMLSLAARLSGGFDPKVHRGVGYSLRDEWTIDTQPFAGSETPTAGWYLVHQQPLPSTYNRLYRAQDALLAALASANGRPPRRSAVEISYDTLLWHRARGTRLLASVWDWSRTPSSDHGFVAVGEFGDAGLGVIAYSRAVRFGTLGVCPQR